MRTCQCSVDTAEAVISRVASKYPTVRLESRCGTILHDGPEDVHQAIIAEIQLHGVLELAVDRFIGTMTFRPGGRLLALRSSLLDLLCVCANHPYTLDETFKRMNDQRGVFVMVDPPGINVVAPKSMIGTFRGSYIEHINAALSMIMGVCGNISMVVLAIASTVVKAASESEQLVHVVEAVEVEIAAIWDEITRETH